MNASANTPTLESLLQEAARRGASDIHLVPGEPPTYRVKSALQRDDCDPLTPTELHALLAAEFPKEQLSRIGRELGQAIFSYEVPGVAFGRVCVTRAAGVLNAVIRRLASHLPEPESVRLPKTLLEVVQSSHGLIVAAGLAGSGKTTTAMMLLEHLNKTSPVRILTIENPAGMRLEPKQALITQQNVGDDTPTYAAALRAAMCQDPDVIFVGEIPDVATLDACIAAAHTGHLVLTQIHAASPEEAVQRMIEVQPEELQPIFRRQLAKELLAVSVQRLLPMAGAAGVVPAFGVLIVDDEAARAIAEGTPLAERKTPPPAGCQSLLDDVERLVQEGLVDGKAANDLMDWVC